jgi:hypothetical protein
LIEALACEESPWVFGSPLVRDISQPVVRLGFTGDRFVNVGTDGKPTAGNHVAIYDQEADLTWAAAPLPRGTNQENLAAAAAFSLFDVTDWKVCTVKQLIAGPVDYTRFNPVLDHKHFGQWPSEWVRTSTPDADPSDAASYSYVVDLGDGDVYRVRHGDQYHALAVRAGQPLGFQFF